MATYRQEYTVLAEAIVTNAIVVPTDAEVKAGEQPSLYYYTDSAAWDTGAQQIYSKIAKAQFKANF